MPVAVPFRFVRKPTHESKRRNTMSNERKLRYLYIDGVVNVSNQVGFMIYWSCICYKSSIHDAFSSGQ